MKIFSIDDTYILDKPENIKEEMHKKYGFPLESMHFYDCHGKTYVVFGTKRFENPIQSDKQNSKNIVLEKCKTWFFDGQSDEFEETEANTIDYISKNTAKFIDDILQSEFDKFASEDDN